jgi:hypothetical protein
VRRNSARFSLVGDPDNGQVLMHTDLDVNRVGSFDYGTQPEYLGDLLSAALPVTWRQALSR